ncbi:MAG: dipeptidase PepV [Tenericutes bacterium GWE2_38_8]|nr:MAG: dipeptidase PepV [Tenericutes bacterium GWA2_38_26]OHE32729.1 MAG: dipeptidase PepV [Tenericutes bacterium GWD2_38_27]OHE37741.1 MAG: dipeptidase PepV [Tenericutes bacterium GWE2_38_8]HBG33672.1 dipeptidase PepV [Acholeplasmataceae bacterium]HCB67221.1 dipeptidase PepV [Acholeplasmataceae bacterium]
MSINFRDEVLKRKDQLLQDLTKIIQINSEMTTFDPKRKNAPFGEGLKEALDFMLALGKRDGFETVNVDGYAGHIEFGNQKDFVGIIGHLDVVPAGNDWTYAPYGAEIHDGKMYGRGTEDDKGPTIAAYYAMKILKELNVPLSKRVKLIVGNDEETAWRCVRHYFSVYPESPVSGFIPDADFPLIYAEKGISRIMVEGKIDSKDIVSIDGGFRDNMVPDYATAVLNPTKDFKSLFSKFLKDKKYEGTTKENNGLIVLTVVGKSAHGSTPQFGENAIDRMFEFFIQAGINDKMVKMVEALLLNDTLGKKLGVSYHDQEMGDLTNNFGVIKTNGKKYEIALNLRYPNGVSFDEVVLKLKKEFALFGATVTVDKHQLLLYKDPNSDLVKKLMGVYVKHTGDTKAKPINIGGGTFARAMPNCVAFGPHFLDKPTFIHQKNEFIGIDDLILATIIYTEALYELAK